jgi:hypothetical protein
MEKNTRITMKQYTTPDQTAKLIELGFTPELRIKGVRTVHSKVEIDHDCNFAIGELIKMLPPHITHGDRGFISYLSIAPYVQGWKVTYTHIYIMLDSELVDALYHTIVKLKEEEVI